MINVDTNELGEKSISFIGRNTEGFCFDGWTRHSNDDGVNVRFYLFETLHEVDIKFNDLDMDYQIRVADYM